MDPLRGIKLTPEAMEMGMENKMEFSLSNVPAGVRHRVLCA